MHVSGGYLYEARGWVSETLREVHLQWVQKVRELMGVLRGTSGNSDRILMEPITMI